MLRAPQVQAALRDDRRLTDGYLLAFFNPADELRRVLTELAESDGVHQPMVAHVLLRTTPRINVVTDTRAQITSMLYRRTRR